MADVRLGTLLGLLSAFGFASGPIFAVLLYRQGFEWTPLLAWRFLIAAGVAWVVVAAVPAYRAEFRALASGQVRLLVGLGVIFVGAAATYYAALVYVPVSVAVLVVNLSPGIIAIFSIWLGFSLQGWRAWGALGIATLGAVLAVLGPTGAMDLRGVGLAMLSAVLYAFWAILAARSAGERKDSRVEGTSSGLAVAIMFTATALSLVVLVFAQGNTMSLPGLSWEGLAYLLGFALIGSILGIQASYASAARLGASRAGVFMTAEPIFTIFLAALLLGETMTPIQLLGGILVVSGILLIRTSLNQAPGSIGP
jgi:drug/metabolite transporter (DMT)-like permease